MSRLREPALTVLFGLGVALQIAQLPSRAIAEGAAADVLPSWNEGTARREILAFVRAVTDEGARTFVAPENRIAAFDNDGTLWVEQPLYIQLQFAIDRVRALAPSHPEWKQQEPFRSILAGDRKALANMNEHDVGALVAATHSGMTAEEFARVAKQWFATARHPQSGRPYRESVYQPMLELLGYLRANGFRTFVVTGGGIDFLRAIAGDLYGVEPAQVIGSSGKTSFELRDGKPALIKLPEVSSIDDGPGKPINIHLHIGQRPILAFGNSDGDLQMLQYTDAGSGSRLMMLLHHDDARREYAYDRTSRIGKLDRALDAAAERGWTVVSMRSDWNRIFPGK